MIVKERSHATNWAVYHVGTGNTNFLKLNDTAAVEDTDNWNDTDPTSSVFSLGGGGQTNTSSRTYINYVFANVQGFSRFGKYTGNGNADGTFIYTGFRPAMVMFKQSSAAGEKWYLFDSTRNTFNLANELLMPSDGLAESVNTSGAPIDILSNGFKIRGTDAAGNASGATYVFLAWAEAPFVNSEGVPCNAR